MIPPLIADADVRIWQGDALSTLREMRDESVQSIVTSPPFWALRDYGVDGQIGREATPEEWCARLVDVFREARRVLRNDGVMWLECGDTFNAFSGRGNRDEARADGLHGAFKVTKASLRAHGDAQATKRRVPTLKPKDLVGAPWMLAFALRSDGWYLRSDTIWARPNPMPESVTDRPTKAHSYVFLLSKSARYCRDEDRRQALRDPRDVITARLHQNADWPTRWLVTVPEGPRFHHFFAPTESDALAYAGNVLARR